MSLQRHLVALDTKALHALYIRLCSPIQTLPNCMLASILEFLDYVYTRSICLYTCKRFSNACRPRCGEKHLPAAVTTRLGKSRSCRFVASSETPWGLYKEINERVRHVEISGPVERGALVHIARCFPRISHLKGVATADDIPGTIASSLTCLEVTDIVTVMNLKPFTSLESIIIHTDRPFRLVSILPSPRIVAVLPEGYPIDCRCVKVRWFGCQQFRAGHSIAVQTGVVTMFGASFVMTSERMFLPDCLENGALSGLTSINVTCDSTQQMRKVISACPLLRRFSATISDHSSNEFEIPENICKLRDLELVDIIGEYSNLRQITTGLGWLERVWQHNRFYMRSLDALHGFTDFLI